MRRILSHTADLRAEITAADLPGLYQEAAALVREIQVGESAVERTEARAVELVAGEEAERLFRFLRELIYLADTERFLPAEAELGNGTVKVTGERFDGARHRSERQLKAITRHRFELERHRGEYRCRMLFDL